ncbi:MAG: glycosyltransferase [Terracidiphilus sp.]|jgi:glycosyltransferase involved in cell wall biosynthesis
MKIAVVTRYFPSSAEPWQGRSAWQTLRVLARLTDLRVFYPNASYPSWLKPRSRGYDRLDSSFSPPDVQAGYYDFPALPVLSRPLNGWMAARALLPHVRAFAPDLIFSYFLYPDGYAALKIGKALELPVVVKSIGSDLNRIGDPISALLTREVLRKADLVLTVSDDLRRKAVAMGAVPQTTRAIVNGCDLSVFHPMDRQEARRELGIDPAAKAIVYLGRMDVRKGLRELVEAADALRSPRPNLHVYMAGAGPDRPLILSAIQARDAAGFIHALPSCTFDEVPRWMAAADLVTLPSYMEGCPNVVLEALASGRPVVATRVGGIPEILSAACGRLVPPRDSEALAEALASVLDTAWSAEAIAAYGSRSWETVAAEMLEIFASLLSSHGKRSAG